MTDWQRIVRKHGGVVWHTAYRLLGNHEEAADCFQETFMAALKLSPCRKVRNWRAMLVRVCTCRALDQLRSRLRQADRQKTLADWTTVTSPNPGPVEQAEAAELSVRLRIGLASLPEQQAAVFCLRCFDDLSYREIARQLGIKTSAVGVLLHRSRARLRELLPAADARKLKEVRP